MVTPPGIAQSANEQKPLGPVPRAERASDPAPGEKPLWSQSLQTGAALATVLALVWGGAKIVRRLSVRGGGGLLAALGPGGRAPSGVLEVLGRFPAGRGTTLVLLKLDRRVLLLCQTHGRGNGGMSTLCEVTDPDEVAGILLRTRDEAGETIATRFREHLEREGAEPEPAYHDAEGPGRQPRAEREGVNALRGRLASMRRRGGETIA
ncbi:MAG: hypothetical protein DYG92_11270 [Leptolyngbya sp. PLA1]|nr:hypothetical protein [Leptolyngbya sp. PLA1]